MREQCNKRRVDQKCISPKDVRSAIFKVGRLEAGQNGAFDIGVVMREMHISGKSQELLFRGQIVVIGIDRKHGVADSFQNLPLLLQRFGHQGHGGGVVFVI